MIYGGVSPYVPGAGSHFLIRLCGACAVDIEALGVPTPPYDAQDVVIVVEAARMDFDAFFEGSSYGEQYDDRI
jgi:hypothetical protein